jgi:hypothetical protein
MRDYGDGTYRMALATRVSGYAAAVNIILFNVSRYALDDIELVLDALRQIHRCVHSKWKADG